MYISFTNANGALALVALGLSAGSKLLHDAKIKIQVFAQK